MHCSDEEPTLDSVHELILGASRALVLKTALELDVFTLISRGNRRLADIANSAGFEQKGLRTMLDALCPMGFLAKTSGEYVLTPVSEKFLVRDAETYYGHTYVDALLLTGWEEESEVTRAIREGSNLEKDITTRNAEWLWKAWAHAHSVFWRRTAQDARQLWAKLGISPTTYPEPKILDLACGTGVWTFVLAQDNPNARITAVDYNPEVLEAAKKLAEKMAVRERVTFRSGHLLEIEMPQEGFDIAYCGGTLYLFTIDQIQEFARRVYRFLRPGGLVVANSLIADEARCEAEPALMQAFRRFVYNGGNVATFQEYKDAFAAAGFVDVEQRDETLMTAEKV